MLGQGILRSFLSLVSLCIVLSIGIISCGGDGDDANEWVGTWALEIVDGETFEETFAEEGVDVSLDPNNWTFNADGTMEMEFGIKIEVKEEGLEISGEGLINMTGTYSLSGSNYTFTPIEVKGSGLFEGEIEPVGPTNEDTGTWSRTGNRLTLNSDDGSTIVFKKK